jgi:hypothetical protein
MTRTEFDAVCATLELEFAISQTSGRRTIRHNKDVGGHASSFHLSGRGRDYVWDTARVRRDHIARFRRRAKGMSIKVVEEGDHEHLQPLPARRK